MTLPTSTSLVQRIEAALSGNDLHSSEVAGLIEAANKAAIRLENLISQLTLLHSAVLSQEKLHQKTAAEKAAQQPQDMNARVFAAMQDPNWQF